MEKKYDSQVSKSFNLLMCKEMFDDLRTVSYKDHISMSHHIRRAIRNYLNDYFAEPKHP